MEHKLVSVQKLVTCLRNVHHSKQVFKNSLVNVNGDAVLLLHMMQFRDSGLESRC